MKKIFILILPLILLACSLAKDNPLDPGSENGVEPPIRVSGIDVSKISSSGPIRLTWNQSPTADGYYIYRSQSYYGEYILHKTIEAGETTLYDDFTYVSGNFYYYIMSAYRLVGDQKLEGYRSEKNTWGN
ncbi:MAG: hypothetical protein R6U84_03240 [Candidatus Cloacimonadales bacterium]